ncbi:Putative acyl-CoA dehydrogenase YdbM [Aquisphaera giovannonii]|uniref:Acyl-CoA dehydrogenase YdbM n=1 Tax=Aquisphaera giovannonii TaxID=406548 RepID=A0A5B9WEC8_9BACT|nr:acyl-CoA dehydrogenase family protein [Aquisphaera giovannonii]QEH38564.1 Putative acyl-CoA dehydrogenase YdbM [Aquisphaera giovannonii]
MTTSPHGSGGELIERISALARGKFAARADRYDREAAFPAEDFEDLFRAGLLAPAAPRELGGLGLGPESGLYTLWMLTKELARADMALARCWEGHVNCQVLLSALADERQQRRWFEGIVGRGEIWAAWSGEPQARIPGQKARFGTAVRPVTGGYLVDGTKVFATGSRTARWAILLVNLQGPGGARHSSAVDGLLLLACDLADPSVQFDESWWDPIGMRGTVSYLVRFRETFIPAENRIGHPGQYLREGWQALFSPHYGATFLGGAEGACDYALDYIRAQDKAGDPYVQQRVATMALNLESAHLWLRRVADLWQARRAAEARSAGIRARYLLEAWATDTVRQALHTCGARGLIRPSPLERIYRDLSFYVLHDNSDQVLATIGREILGQSHDASFFNAPPRPASGDANGRRPES